MKGSTAWRLRQPRPGTLVWTAPSGLSWTVTPRPLVAWPARSPDLAAVPPWPRSWLGPRAGWARA